MWNGHNGLDRAYELEGFGNLAKVIAFTRATGEVARCRSVLGQAQNALKKRRSPMTTPSQRNLLALR